MIKKMAMWILRKEWQSREDLHEANIELEPALIKIIEEQNKTTEKLLYRYWKAVKWVKETNYLHDWQKQKLEEEWKADEQKMMFTEKQ